jgi:hypothetical protein
LINLGEKGLLVFLQLFLQPLGIRQVQRQQFFIPVKLIGDCTLSYLHPASLEFLMDLGNATLFLIAQRPD